MWATSASLLFVARVVFPGEPDQPTICSHIEVSRLLHRRLEVLEAALRELGRTQRNAADAL
jgi:hypothetical protein